MVSSVTIGFEYAQKTEQMFELVCYKLKDEEQLITVESI